MKKLFVIILTLVSLAVHSQELYVFSEPASNVPAHSLSLKFTDHLVSSDNIYKRLSQRFMPQVSVGVNRKLMLRGGITVSNMHTTAYKYESFNLYAKYRFLSKDDVHKHFRMAAFADGSVTKAPFHYDEITMMGDKSGIELGLIATQLWHKFALSGTVSHTQVLDKSRNSKTIYIPVRSYQSVNYSLSGGLLVLPKEYNNYKQVNLNIYTEILGEQSLDIGKYCLDLAPAAQLIFNSNLKVNIGYRFQMAGNMQRMTNNSWQFSIERTFLNTFKSKK